MCLNTYPGNVGGRANGAGEQVGRPSPGTTSPWARSTLTMETGCSGSAPASRKLAPPDLRVHQRAGDISRRLPELVTVDDMRDPHGT